MPPHPRRVAPLVLGTALATILLVAPVAAQDETQPPEGSLPPAACDVLTADEVSDAFGEALTLVDGSGASCQFDSDIAAGRALFVFTNLDEGDIDSLRPLLCEEDPSVSPAPSSPPCTDLAIAGKPAMFSEAFGLLLHVESDAGHTFWVQLVGDPIEGVDARTAMAAVAELALPRIGVMPASTAGPTEPSAPLEQDEELEALYPAEIAGSALTVETRRGESALVDTEPDIRQLMLDALAAQGRSVGDLSIGFGTTDDGAIQIVTLRVRGTDIRPFVADLLGAFIDGPAPSMTPEGVAPGKDVSSITQDGQQVYVYPRDDVLWLVAADGAALVETFTLLP
jgi:hypothetical protein